MKLIFIFYILIINLNLLNAKTLCSMTFNSADEKEVLKKHLTPVGYKHIELVPNNKDPNWFDKACTKVESCDVLVVSGHFGGIFFGEKSSTTLSLNELNHAKNNSLCPSILNKPKTVFLMGCNTLSSKTPDHRSVDDYLRVLVHDGFPLSLAEEVAASRYLSFGQSMEEQMSTIFKESQLIIGFESTGPLGAVAAPKLEKALTKTSKKDKERLGINRDAILNAFKGTNLKAISPKASTENVDKFNALSTNQDISNLAWKNILKKENISKNYDFILKKQNNDSLSMVINADKAISLNLFEEMNKIYLKAKGLSEIQTKIVSFLHKKDLISFENYEQSLAIIIKDILKNKIDYIRADQLCSIFKENQNISPLMLLNTEERNKLSKSPFNSFLLKCGGEKLTNKSISTPMKCLIQQTNHDWGCLTENSKHLDVEACTLAKNRNNDLENADDMLWYCYDKMLEAKTLNQAKCLELSHQFSILGNRIKMNWNCLNKVPDILSIGQIRAINP